MKQREKEEPQDDQYEIEILAESPGHIRKLSDELTLYFEHLHQHKEQKGITATGFATEKQIKALEAQNLPVKVLENMSAIGRERQKEVSNTDRFEGGKIAPKGLGIKK